MKTVQIKQLFNTTELTKARRIIQEELIPTDRLVQEIVEPKMQHINAVTEQTNDSRYIAYLLQYVLGGNRTGG